MEKFGVESMVAGPSQHAQQRLGLWPPSFPNRLEIVRRVELPQQGGMHFFAPDAQIRGAVDTIADRRGDRNGDRRRSRFGGGRGGRSDQRNRVSGGGRDGGGGQ